MFWGETALSAGGSNDAIIWWRDDVASVHLRNALWASVVSTAAGGAMHWWCKRHDTAGIWVAFFQECQRYLLSTGHEFDDHNAYQHFAPVKRFVDRLPLLRRHWRHTPIWRSNESLPERSCSLPSEPGHFPKSEGHVITNFAGGNPETCQQHCCVR